MDEAVELANATRYGLGAAVFSQGGAAASWPGGCGPG